MAGDAPMDQRAPADAFALVGNETRAEILRVLGEEPWAGLSFSELRSRVDPDLDSGQFNYHLQQLVGQFDCYFCGSTVEASYEDGIFHLRCPGCDHVYSHTMAPPSAVEGVAREELLARIDQYNRHTMLAFARGVCPVCVHGVDREFIPGESAWSEGVERFDLFVRHTCGYCGNRHFMSVGLALLYRPLVVCFFHGRGLDVTSAPHWELEFAMTDRDVTVRSRDPWEVALETTCDGDRLELVVDETLGLVEQRVVSDVE